MSERLTKRKYGEIVSSEKEISCSNFCNKCSQGSGNCKYVKEMIEKLAEYEDLEEQGLLLRLPCKVGDTVWEIVDECEGDNAGCYGTCDTCHNRRLGIIENQFTIDMIDEFENWFFLTKSEAEEKLRELEKSR